MGKYGREAEEEESYDFGGVCHAVFDSGNALKVQAPGKGEIWVPHSVILDDSEVYEEGGRGKLIVAYWWAEKRGYI